MPTVLFVTLLLPWLVAAAEESGSTIDIPMWALVLIAVVLALLLAGLAFFVIRRFMLRKRRHVDTMDILEKQPTNTNDSMVTAVEVAAAATKKKSKPAVTTTSTASRALNKSPKATSTTAAPLLAAPTPKTSTTSPPPPTPPKKQMYKPSMVDPVSLASSDLFNDKMEINSQDAMQLFERYLHEDRQQKSMVNTMQQKMGTLRSTLRQSLRRQKTKSLQPPPLRHMFDAAAASSSRTSIDMLASSAASHSNISHASSSSPTASSQFPLHQQNHQGYPKMPTFATPSPTSPSRPHSTSTFATQPTAESSSPTLTATSQVAAPELPPKNHQSHHATLPSIKLDDHDLDAYHQDASSDKDNHDENDTDEDHPVAAARRVIRSSSRKYKTRSTLINEEAVLKMFQQEEERYDQMLINQEIDTKKTTTTKKSRNEPPSPPSNQGSRRPSQDATSSLSGVSLQRRDTGKSTRYLTDDVLLKRGQSMSKEGASEKRKKNAIALPAVTSSPLSARASSPQQQRRHHHQQDLVSSTLASPEKVELAADAFGKSFEAAIASVGTTNDNDDSDTLAPPKPRPSLSTPETDRASRHPELKKKDENDENDDTMASTKYAVTDDEFIQAMAAAAAKTSPPKAPVSLLSEKTVPTTPMPLSLSKSKAPLPPPAIQINRSSMDDQQKLMKDDGNDNDAPLPSPRPLFASFGGAPSPSSTISTTMATPSSQAGSSMVLLRQERMMDNFEGRSTRTNSTCHSRKSSGSVATMVRISQHSQTWSGRANKAAARASIPYGPQGGTSSPYYRESSDTTPADDDDHDEFIHHDVPRGAAGRLAALHGPSAIDMMDDDDSPIPAALRHKDLSANLFYTIRSTRPKQRQGLPFWAQEPAALSASSSSVQNSSQKTPAERERDQYLKNLHDS
ncbi:hypothetical protein BC940DRAFT_320228 [Gongronella butleri]|nr:hypothetical protein BC940DRAFT_320228 [Gongronella butleri]